MFRRVTKLSLNVPRKVQIGSGFKYFSSDSHDDFKPQRKVVGDGLDDVIKLIGNQVKENPVMLYMKGTPSQPQCGFSLQVVKVLHATGVEFSSVNILEYPAIREGIKQFSDWPTLPQLYIAGEFIGGCDIVTDMFKTGDLEKLLVDKKLLIKA